MGLNLSIRRAGGLSSKSISFRQRKRKNEHHLLAQQRADIEMAVLALKPDVDQTRYLVQRCALAEVNLNDAMGALDLSGKALEKAQLQLKRAAEELLRMRAEMRAIIHCDDEEELKMWSSVCKQMRNKTVTITLPKDYKGGDEAVECTPIDPVLRERLGPTGSTFFSPKFLVLIPEMRELHHK